MNVYRNVDRKKIQFDFLIRSDKNSDSMLKEINSLGGNIFIQVSFPKQWIKNYVELNAFLKTNASNYTTIHVHVNSLVYVKPLQLAKNMASLVGLSIAIAQKVALQFYTRLTLVELIDGLQIVLLALS